MSRAAVATVVLSAALAGCTSGAARSAPSDAALATDAQELEAATFSCTGPADCNAHLIDALKAGLVGPAAFCCIDKTCIWGQAALATTCNDPDAQVIQASDYDQSCQTDSDCVAVAVGAFCYPGAGCPGAAISKSALGRYQADVSRTQAGVCGAISDCLQSAGPCCRQGTCQMNDTCFPAPSDTLPACVDAGGSCTTLVLQCGGHGAGPPDSCAYSDEMCCLP